MRLSREVVVTRKFGLAVAAAIVVMGSAVSNAAAAPIAATGYLSWSANVITARCDFGLEGDLTGTALAVTDATASNCTVGTETYSGFPWLGTLGAQASINGVEWAWTAPIMGTCSYAGSFFGSYDGVATLTITGNSFVKTGGSLLCSNSPATQGVLTVTY